MLFRFVFLFSISVITLASVGCGGSTGDATYDVESAPPVTEDEIQKREAYEAQMKKEHQEMYGR